MSLFEFTREMRSLQDRFGTRAIADRRAERSFHDRFTDTDQALIESAMFFFLATTDSAGRPQCSYKGGPKGFVLVTGPAEIVFPFYEGNGFYLSAGNIAQTSKVGLLFIDFDTQNRIRVNGIAEIVDGHPAMDGVDTAQMAIRVHVTDIHRNCKRNVHRMQLTEISSFTPRAPDEGIGKGT